MDTRIWKPCPSHVFSSRSFSNEGVDTPGLRPVGTLVRLGFNPPKVEGFCWLAISTRVSMANVLRRRGLSSKSILDIFCFAGRTER